MTAEPLSVKLERLREDLMARINWPKTAVILAGCVLVALLSVFLRWTQIPPPTVTVYPIAEDRGFEMVVVGTKTTLTSPTFSISKREYRHAPDWLDFESTNGPVDVYWAPINFLRNLENQAYIKSLKQEFAEGRVHKAVAGHAAGTSGRLRLEHSSNAGHGIKSYLIMIRSKTENEVTLKVHYGYGKR
jgi:hypothetical protein